MIKVFVPDEYYTPLLGVTKHHDLPFELEKDKFVITHDVSEADIIPVLPSKSHEIVDSQFLCLGTILHHQIIAIMMHTHVHDSDNDVVYREHIEPWYRYTKKVVIIHLNQLSECGIKYDFCFNQVKAYFTEYDKFDLNQRLWTGTASYRMFVLPEIKRLPPHRTFLSPNRVSNNRTGEPRNELRKQLHEFIPSNRMWRGDPESGYMLYPEEINPIIMDSIATGGWAPVANEYYYNSFVSVFIETITWGKKVNTITEKTFTPLVKGHFILPYGYKGLIQDIKDKGFMFPDWIDYSYDSLDDNMRFEGFKQSITKLLGLSEQWLMYYFEQDKHMLEHNRSLFYSKNYDSLYEKIINIV